MSVNKWKKYTTEQIQIEWVGDSALMYLARWFLVKKYPKVPIYFLQARLDYLVSNRSLHEYCCSKKFDFGVPSLERKIGLLLESDLNQARLLIEDIFKNNKRIEMLDNEQLCNNEVKQWVFDAWKNKERFRERANYIRETKGVSGLIEANIITKDRLNSRFR